MRNACLPPSHSGRLARAALAGAALLPCLTTVLGAQGAPPVPRPRPAAAAAAHAVKLDAATRRAVVDTMAGQLRRHYVDADTGRLIAEHMQRRLRSGAYDTVTSPLRFAELLTRDLKAVNGDGHLYVVYNPEDPGLRPGPEGIRMFDFDEPSAPTRPAGPAAPGGPRPGGPSPIAERQRRSHWSLGRVEALPGNVGYMDVRGFSDGPSVEPVMVAALRYLEGTDAMIIDLRRNGGGSDVSVNFLLSHFTGDDTLPSLTVKNRSGNENVTRYTLAKVPGPRRPTVPLYVLTSRSTASAGEDFAFVLRNLGRATLVGDRTAGAGHNNATIDVGHGFGTSISFTRVTDPRTGAEWERVGVQPHIKVDAASALDAAHAHALGALVEREQDPQRRRFLELTREAVAAQASPRAVPAATLAAYAGGYEGGRTVSIDPAGRLLYAPREGALAEPLVAIDETTFAMGALRVVFERQGGRVSGLRVVLPTGEALGYARTGSAGRG